jgi:anti-anti-sigma factor
MFLNLLRCWSKASTQSGQRACSQELPAPVAPLPAERPSARTPRLAVLVSDQADEVLVRLQGEAGFLEAEVLSAALVPVSARRPALVTLDLSELHFISSLVLGILVRFGHSAVRFGGRVQLTPPRPEVREAIERAGLAPLLLEQTSAEAPDEAANLVLASA